jgi:hypothetical protein
MYCRGWDREERAIVTYLAEEAHFFCRMIDGQTDKEQ